MARRADYNEHQAAKRLRVPLAVFRWARHVSLVPAPDASPGTWSRAAVEEMDAHAVRAAMPHAAVTAVTAANRIAQALGTPNVPGRPVVVSAFAVHRLIAQGLLTGLSANPDGALLNPDQVEAMCRRPDLAQCVSPEAPLGPDQAAARLRVRRVDFDHMRTLGWIEPAERREVYFGTSRVNAVLIPMFRTGDIDALPTAHPEIDWDHLRALGKGRRSPLAALAGQHTAPA